MPRFDLAGNPLPEMPSAGAAPPPPASPTRPMVPHADIPPRRDPLGRTLHTAHAPPAQSPPVPAVPHFTSQSSGADTVRYDLAGNVISSAPAPTYSPAPALGAFPLAGAGAPTWPPAPAGMGQPSFHNNSGEQGDLPPEIARLRWNWGAFFFPILWCRKHGMTTLAGILAGSLFALRWARRLTLFVNPALYGFLLLVYGLTYFGIAVYFGFTGHKCGWRNRRFDHVDDYLSCQRKWMWWGFGINGVLTIVLPLLFFAGLVGLGLSASHQAGAAGASSGYNRGFSGNGPSGGFDASPPSNAGGDTSGQ